MDTNVTMGGAGFALDAAGFNRKGAEEAQRAQRVATLGVVARRGAETQRKKGEGVWGNSGF